MIYIINTTMHALVRQYLWHKYMQVQRHDHLFCLGNKTLTPAFMISVLSDDPRRNVISSQFTRTVPGPGIHFHFPVHLFARFFSH